jgi:outer membrane protein assembly factor BamB
MGGDGTIYFTTDTHVAAVTDEGATGSLKWSVEVDDAANSGVVIGPNGELYTGSRGGLLALDPASGAVVWNYSDADIVESVPAVDVNGNIYVGTAEGKLIIVDSAGNLLKELELGDDVVNSPTIMDDGTVFVEATDNLTIKLYKISVENSGPAASAWPMKGQNIKNTAVASQ